MRHPNPHAAVVTSNPSAAVCAAGFSVSFYWSYRLWRKATLTVQYSPLWGVVRDSIERPDGGAARETRGDAGVKERGKNR